MLKAVSRDRIHAGCRRHRDLLTGGVLLAVFCALSGAGLYLYFTRPVHQWYPGVVQNTTACMRNCSTDATDGCHLTGHIVVTYTAQQQVYTVEWPADDPRIAAHCAADCCQSAQGVWWFCGRTPDTIDAVYDSSVPVTTVQQAMMDTWLQIGIMILALGVSGVCLVPITWYLLRPLRAASEAEAFIRGQRVPLLD